MTDLLAVVDELDAKLVHELDDLTAAAAVVTDRRERLAAIRELARDLCQPPAAPPDGNGAGRDTTHRRTPPQVSASTPAPLSPAAAGSSNGRTRVAPVSDAVLAQVTAAGDWIAAREITYAGNRHAILGALQRLVAAGTIEAKGKTSSRRYRLPIPAMSSPPPTVPATKPKPADRGQPAGPPPVGNGNSARLPARSADPLKLATSEREAAMITEILNALKLEPAAVTAHHVAETLVRNKAEVGALIRTLARAGHITEQRLDGQALYAIAETDQMTEIQPPCS